MNLTTAQKAYDMLKKEGIKGVLVGTAALQLHGFRVDAPDLDFLVERAPEDARMAYNPESPEHFHLDGVKVDFIDADDKGRELYFHPETAESIAGIPVARLHDILGLKAWAGREKDATFLAEFASGRYNP